jgi:hypothetical protein
VRLERLGQLKNLMQAIYLVHSVIHQRLYSPLLGPRRLFSFVILYTVARTLRTGDQHVAMPLSTYRTTQTQNEGTQTSMPQVGFDSPTPLFKRAKTFHALDLAASLMGNVFHYGQIFSILRNYIIYLYREYFGISLVLSASSLAAAG